MVIPRILGNEGQILTEDTQGSDRYPDERSEQSPEIRRHYPLWGKFINVLKAETAANWVTAIATVVLAIFAIFAWRAADGQLEELRAEQKPLLWVEEFDNPQLNSDGRVTWNFLHRNIGKSVAYDVHVNRYIKVGNEKFQKGQLIGDDNGVPFVPNEQEFSTAFSRPGVSAEYFTQLMKSNGELGLLVEFDYAAAIGGPRIINAYCIVMTGQPNVHAVINGKDCPKG